MARPILSTLIALALFAAASATAIILAMEIVDVD